MTKPELFYSRVFLKTHDSNGSSQFFIPTIFHATHCKDMTSICQGKEAIFKGNPKQWRPSLEHSPSPNASYHIRPGSTTKTRIPSGDNECLPGPLLWFGTERKGGSVYGPCEYEFKFTALLKAYQLCRGINAAQVCYRAAGTLVYQQEISHVVLVCSTSDDCYKSFPLIQENNTKYFKPPNDKEIGKQKLMSISTNAYPQRSHESGKDHTRHDHVIIAFYLPENTQLVLPNKPYISELQIIPHYYCMKNKLEGGGCCSQADSKAIQEAIYEKWGQYRKPYK